MKKHIILLLLSIVFYSCEDFVTKEPVNVITPDQVIIDGASAEAAILGVYSRFQTAGMFGTRVIADPGVLSDELIHSGSFPSIAEMDQNNVTSRNATIDDTWTQAYTSIYQCNNILEVLGSGTFEGLSTANQNRILAEARFLRALGHFIVANHWGATPIATTTSLSALSSLSRTSQSETYQFVADEAAAAAAVLADATFASDQVQFRANQWAAKALQARALLYNGDVSGAGAIADDIITNSGAELAGDYTDLFGAGPIQNSEILLSMFYASNDQNGLPFQFLPDGRFEFAVSPKLISAFGTDDKRALIAVNSGDPQGRTYVNKYVDLNNGTDGVIVFRLAEMYLIRAEANISTNPTQALADVNLLRTRAGVTPLTTVNLDAILEERFLELSFEGHRWYDLRRTGKAVETMTAINSDFTANDVLLPVPQRDREQNPNLSQNDGY